MGTNAKDSDPWASADPALAIALHELRWFRRSGARARILNRTSEVLLLMTTAATTVAAALSAIAWVTAVLAATSLILSGLRRSFDWHENWVSFTARWSTLRTIVHQYQLLPEERRDEAARSNLLAAVDDIVSTETESWAVRRRRFSERVQAEPQ